MNRDRICRVAWILALAILLATASVAHATLYYNAGVNNSGWDNGATSDWSTTSLGAYNQPWSSGSDAWFEGTAGTVTVGSISNVNSVTFNQTGYVLNGGSIILTGSGGSITTNSTYADTISSILAGGVGLTKLGNGTLNLSPSNTYTGNTTLSAGMLGITRTYTSTISPFGASSGTLSINGGAITAYGYYAGIYGSFYAPYAPNPYTLNANVAFGDTTAGTSTYTFYLGGAGTITTPNPTITVNNVYNSDGSAGAVILGDPNANLTTSYLTDNGLGFTKAGPGTLILAGLVSQYSAGGVTGPIVVNSGTLQFGYANAGGGLNTGAGTVTVNNAATVTIGTNMALWRTDVILNGASSGLNAGSTGYLAFLGGLSGGASTTTVDFVNGQQINLDNGFSLSVGYNNLNETFNGKFVDTNGTPYSNVVKYGTGTWTLTGASTITGTTWFKSVDGVFRSVPDAYAPSFVLRNGGLAIGANGDTTSGGPVGKGPLLIAGIDGPVTLTSNSTSGYTIANPVVFGNTATGVSTSSVTLGDAGNDALTLSGPVTLAAFNYGNNTTPGTISGPLALTLITPGNGVTISGNISEAAGAAGSSLIKDGPGMLTVSGSLSYTGQTVIKAGTLEAIGAGGLGLLGSAGLDIQHGQAVLDYTGLTDPMTLDPIANTLMQQARANGWVIDATHPIGSTTAAANPLVDALGWTDTVVGGRTLLTVMYTLCGDADLNGVVNGADLNTVLSNYNKTGMYWSQGDFNYDGTVNGADLNSVLSNYNQSVSVGAAVPEPSTLLLAAAGLAGLLAYAWRKRK